MGFGTVLFGILLGIVIFIILWLLNKIFRPEGIDLREVQNLVPKSKIKDSEEKIK